MVDAETAIMKAVSALRLGARRQPEEEQELSQRAASAGSALVRRRSKAASALAAARQHPAGAAAVSLVAAYASLRLAVSGFHHLRRRSLRRLLLDLCPVLTQLGQTWWADFGCLLGVHRDGDLILHDNDIDLAVLNPDWPALLEGLHRLLPPRYSVKVVTPQGRPGSSWIRVYCPLGMADLFGAYQNRDREEVEVDCGHGDTMHIPAVLVLPPASRRWRGAVLNVPADVEGTLRRRYGPDWRTPAYMEKGADTVEGNKPYAKLFRALARLGIRI